MEDLQLSDSLITQTKAKAVKANDFYANKSLGSVSLVPATVRHGLQRFSANQKMLNSTSDFIISGSELAGRFMLCASVKNVVNSTIPYGWLFNVIKSVQINFQGNANNIGVLTVNGETLKNYALWSCNGREQRQAVFDAAGSRSSTVNETVHGCIPLSTILQASSPESFLLDMSVFKNIRISISFFGGESFMYETSGAAVLHPVAFESLEIVCSSVQFKDSKDGFTGHAAIMSDLQLVNPTKYISEHREIIPSYNFTDKKIIQLSDLPDGHVSGMLLSLRPIDYETNPYFNKHPFTAPIDKLSLKFNGTELVRWDSEKEYEQMTALNQGEDGTFTYRFSQSGVYSAVDLAVNDATHLFGDSGQVARTINACKSSYLVPLSFHSDKILGGNHAENLPNYAGRSLSLEITPKATYTVDREYIRPNAIGLLTNYAANKGTDQPIPIFSTTSIATSTADAILNITYITEASILSDMKGSKLVK